MHDESMHSGEQLQHAAKPASPSPMQVDSKTKTENMSITQADLAECQSQPPSEQQQEAEEDVPVRRPANNVAGALSENENAI